MATTGLCHPKLIRQVRHKSVQVVCSEREAACQEHADQLTSTSKHRSSHDRRSLICQCLDNCVYSVIHAARVCSQQTPAHMVA